MLAKLSVTFYGKYSQIMTDLPLKQQFFNRRYHALCGIRLHTSSLGRGAKFDDTPLSALMWEQGTRAI
jgi:hypothetical protein